jgi:hypothetical protein
MEEIIDKLRKFRKIFISPQHFFERVEEKKLFSSLEKANKITINAIRSFGVFIYPLMRDDCKYLCLFKSDKGIIVCCPVTFVSMNTFLIKTIYPANNEQIKIYKRLINKRKQDKSEK